MRLGAVVCLGPLSAWLSVAVPRVTRLVTGRLMRALGMNSPRAAATPAWLTLLDERLVETLTSATSHQSRTRYQGAHSASSDQSEHAAEQGFSSGRGWDRTSDPSRVNRSPMVSLVAVSGRRSPG